MVWAIVVVLFGAIQYGCGLDPNALSNLKLSGQQAVPQTTTSLPSGTNVQAKPASADGMELVVTHPHSYFTSAVALSPDGRYIVSGSYDGSAKLWDATSGQVVRTFPGLIGLNAMGVDEVVFSNEGDKVAVSGIGDRGYQFEVATGRELPGEPKLAPPGVSPDGRLKVSEPGGVSSGRLNVGEIATRRTVQTLETGMASAWGITNTMRFSRDGRHFAWAGVDLVGSATAKIWETGTWKLIATLPASAVNFSRDSRTLVLGRLTGAAPYLRDLASGEETHLVASAGPSGVVDIAMAGDGRSVLVGMVDGSARLWDLSNGQVVRGFECPKSQPVASVAVGQANSLAVTGCMDGSVWLWDVSTGKQVRNLAPSLSHSVLHQMTRFSADGQALVYDTGEQLSVWNAGESKEPRRLTLPQNEASEVYEYKFKMEESEKQIRDRKDIPKEIKEKYLRDMEQATESMMPKLKEQSKVIQTLAVHPNGHLVAVAKTGGLFLVETKTGQVVRKIDNKVARHLVFSPDGQTLLSEEEAWDPSTGKMKPTAAKKAEPDPSSREYFANFTKHMDEMHKVRGPVAISMDNRLGARVENLKINVWDLTSGKTQELSGHTGKITAVAFAPNGRLLVSGSSDGTVRLWDLQNGKEIAALISLGNGESMTVTPDHYYRASKNPVKGVSFQVGDKLLPFEQFAEKLNKPDIVQQRLSEFFSHSAQR
jgi:WD40 repeat protein